MKYVFLLTILLAAYSAPALADECLNAVTQQDLDACSANIATKDDAELNRVYRALVKFFQDDSITNIQLKDLKAAEKAWIAYRDAECTFEAEGYDGGSIQPMIESNCLAALTVQQTKRLQSELPN